MEKQLDLFRKKYTYAHLSVGLIEYDPLNKSWHRWVSDKWKVFTKRSLEFHGLSYSDMSRGY